MENISFGWRIHHIEDKKTFENIESIRMFLVNLKKYDLIFKRISTSPVKKKKRTCLLHCELKEKVF